MKTTKTRNGRVSEKQFRANLVNAQRSTGPRTDAGKAKSASNSQSHGLTKQEGLLEGEDPEEFEKFSNEFLNHLKPIGPIEGVLARRCVWLAWRCNVRFPRIEAQISKILMFKRIEGEHRQPFFYDPDDDHLAGIRNLSDEALADDAEVMRSVDCPSPQSRLEDIATGKAIGVGLKKALGEYLETADEKGQSERSARLYKMEVRQAFIQAEAARRVASGRGVAMGLQMLEDARNGNVLDRLHRYMRETLSDLLKVTRELERLQRSRLGLGPSDVAVVDVNHVTGGDGHGR